MDFRAALITDGIDEITVDRFLTYHRERREIWIAFEAKAIELINAGIRRWGAKAIMEVIRFETTIEKKGEFKVCNSFTAYYARAFHLKYPQHKGFFEEREVKGLREAA